MLFKGIVLLYLESYKKQVTVQWLTVEHSDADTGHRTWKDFLSLVFLPRNSLMRPTCYRIHSNSIKQRAKFISPRQRNIHAKFLENRTVFPS